MNKKTKAYWWLICSLAIIKFILPFLVQSPVYELQRDEFLYYQQGQHLALGYLENPPLLSYLATISSWLGGTEFWIRFWPSLVGALTLMLTCLLTAELGGRFFAQLLAGIGVMTGAFLRVHVLFQPNILDIFFWTLSIYFLVLFLRSKKTNQLIYFACSIALGFWGKYSIVFLAAAILISLLLTKHRKIFLQQRIYTALLLVLIIIAPNIYWQYSHNWPLIHHMEELRKTQLQFLDPVDFIKDQFMMTLPVVFVWIAGLFWLFKNKELRFLGFSYLFVILLLIVSSGKSYYALGIYPPLFAAGAIAWQTGTEKIKWLQPVIIILIVSVTYLILPMALPIYEPAKLAALHKEHGIKHTWEDLKEHDLSQDFADMLGWKELTAKTESFYNRLPDTTKQHTIIYCRNYGQAGSLQFYGKDETFKKKVISDNGSFLLWIPANMNFKNLVLVGHNIPAADEEIFQHFEKRTVIDSVTNMYSRQLGDKVIFFEHADDKAVKLATEGLKEMKKTFSRQ